MLLLQLVRSYRSSFLLLTALLLLTSPLTTSSGSLIDIARAASPSVGDSSAAECSVPGDFSTIQGAVDDAGCTSIAIGSGVFYENVIINRSLTITGQGAANTTVDGSGTGTVFTIQSGTVVTMTGLRITNVGAFYSDARGIYNEGRLTVNDSTISNNSASSEGGGILNFRGELTVNNSAISDNWAATGGGGIVNIDGTMNINNSTIDNNSAGNGGGVNIFSGTTTIDNSTISNNSAERGGGIYNSYGTVDLSNSTIDNNSAGSGGGVNIFSGTATIDNSTISDNSADVEGGGVVNVSRDLTIDSSTISNNSATSGGSGIHNGDINMPGEGEGNLTIKNSTISNNIAGDGTGGIYNSYGTVDLSNSIVAYNATSDDCTGYSAGIISQGFNLDSDNTCNLTATGDLPNHDPRLGPLQDNGGNTLTHALLSDSPAVDAGNCPGATSDQRGYARPVDVSGVANVADGCDIGAFEYVPDIVPVNADFSASPTSGIAPFQVGFKNLSSGDFDTCSWDFGDGEKSSDCGDPQHRYDNPGTYTVSLTVTGPGGEETKTRDKYITVYKPVNADFNASPTSGAAPLTAKFRNRSSGDFDECTWDLGDGRTSTECAGPSHTYSSSGTYTVALTVKGPGGEHTKTRTGYILVTDMPIADFSASPTSGVPPLAVNFTNLSTGNYDECLWDFGDGQTSTTCENQVHSYITEGHYTVSLTVRGAEAEDTKTVERCVSVTNYRIFLPVMLGHK